MDYKKIDELQFDIFELRAIIKFIEYALDVENVGKLPDGDNLVCDYLEHKRREIGQLIFVKGSKK